MRKTYYASQSMLNMISDAIETMETLETMILHNEEMCDNDCRNERNERCPFNIHVDVCSLDKIKDELSDVYKILEKELVIRSREE